jgi:hypothetical protein
LTKADPDAITKFEALFDDMKSGQGVPKKLWEKQNMIDDTPAPQEITMNSKLEEMDEDDKVGDENEMEDIQVIKSVTDLCSSSDETYNSGCD